MINRDDYVYYDTKNLYKVTGDKKSGRGKRCAFTVPFAMLKLMGLSDGGSVSISMAKDMSHIIVEPVRDSENTELKHEPK